MASITVNTLRGDINFGARINGVTWENLGDPSVRQEISDVFVARGLIVFEDMEPTSRMQVELSKVFGPMKDHPTKSVARDEETGDAALGVIDMHYVPGDDPYKTEGLVEYKGQLLARYSPWHFDHC